MLEDMVNTIANYEKASTAQQCEAVVHHLDNVVRHARELMARMHVTLEKRQAEEYSREVAARRPDFPPAQQMGAK